MNTEGYIVTYFIMCVHKSLSSASIPAYTRRDMPASMLELLAFILRINTQIRKARKNHPHPRVSD